MITILDYCLLTPELMRERYHKLFILANAYKLGARTTFDDIFTSELLDKHYLMNVPNEYLVGLSVSSITEILAMVAIHNNSHPGAVSIHSIHNNGRMILKIDANKFPKHHWPALRRDMPLEDNTYPELDLDSISQFNIFVNNQLAGIYIPPTKEEIQKVIDEDFLSILDESCERAGGLIGSMVDLMQRIDEPYMNLLKRSEDYMKVFKEIRYDTRNNVQPSCPKEEIRRTFPLDFVLFDNTTNEMMEIISVCERMNISMKIIGHYYHYPIYRITGRLCDFNKFHTLMEHELIQKTTATLNFLDYMKKYLKEQYFI